MSKFKIIFEVRDEAGSVIVEKNQTWVEVSYDELKGESPQEGAQRVAALPVSERIIEAMKSIPDRDFPLEALRAAGEVVARFITLRLRAKVRGG